MKYLVKFLVLLLVLSCKGKFNLLQDDLDKTDNVKMEITDVDPVDGIITYTITNENDNSLWLNTHRMFWKLNVQDVEGENIRRNKIIEQGVRPRNTQKFVTIPGNATYNLELETNFLTQYIFENHKEYLLSSEYFNEENNGQEPTILGRISATSKKFKLKI